MENKKNVIKEEYLNMISDVEKEAWDLFGDATDNREFSENELLELIKKNTELNNRLGEILCKINDESEQKVMQSASNREKSRRLIIILNALNIAFSFFVPAFSSLITSAKIVCSFALVIFVISKLKENAKIIEEIDERVKVERKLVDRGEKLCINLDNNDVLLKKKLKDINMETYKEITKPTADTVVIANLIIQTYFITGCMPMNLDQNIENMIISILKSDLETDENDLETLLEMARKKVKIETKGNTIKLTMNDEK